ncbi:MAG: hypothetical protein MK078_00035 [Crocinitomicaceae bacterium]|nr:hypothetical protein [Crocinitomicaceae bacterium]
MKTSLFLFSLLCFGSQIFAQQKWISDVQIEQNGKIISAKKGVVNINQTPFSFILNTRLNNQGVYLGILSFTEDDTIPEEKYTNASIGGAFSYGSKDNILYVWKEKRITYLPYENDSMHCFDSTSYKGKWLTGYYHVDEISTQNEYSKIEDYKDSILFCYIAALIPNKSGGHHVLDEFVLEIHMHPQSIAPNQVKGKTFSEPSGEFEEGCEGCGNGAYFQFSKDGNTLEYLLSGSDIISFGYYKQEGNQVYILETEYSFTISEDGTILSDNLYENITYRIEE